jgi:hypothetical protein
MKIFLTEEPGSSIKPSPNLYCDGWSVTRWYANQIAPRHGF